MGIGPARVGRAFPVRGPICRLTGATAHCRRYVLTMTQAGQARLTTGRRWQVARPCRLFDTCAMWMPRCFGAVSLGAVAAWTGVPLFQAAQAQPAPPIPFVLPWNDAAPGVTDFSAFNAPITGDARVGVSSNGQFVVQGRRIRFLGVNFASDSPFMPTNKADAVAARLAKFGVNNVRFHHMDAPWAYNGGLLSYTSTRSTNVNATQLERLHFLIARLKAHGIYADINLLVGREYRSQDGLGSAVTGMDWKDQHILGYFNDTALALHKDYATKLLTPTNRFTGLSLAQDPAVAFVEIINENGLIQKWLDGGLDRLPSAYAPQLQARWNDWLAARYGNDAALLAAWNVINVPLGPNVVANGNFSNGLTGWTAEQHDTARASFTRTFDFTGGQPSARIVVTNVGSASWHIQLNYPGLRVTNGQPYTVSFWAKASPATNFDVAVMQAHPDWLASGFGQSFNLTTNWQQFTNTFQANMTDSNVRVNFGGMGQKLGTFWVADVRFQAGGQIGTLPPGASLATRTIPNVRYAGDGFRGTTEARKDWLRFLRDLEHRYYDIMVAHVRTNCGYPGLIFGTIMMNSPATVQRRLDVIDGHAYWQHPQFPNRPWDPVDWTVANVSMVNTLGDDNTLAALARQRIKGKPFTVTEYNHPQPMYYGAEGPLLLAAYGAFQDWDGIWMFDYGHGQDGTATMGYARGFFDTAQHSGKMANLLLAANLFRRGDVQPAETEITMALWPEREIDLLANTWAWNVFSARQMGLSAKHAFLHRLSTDVGEAPVGLTNAPAAPSGNVLISDTGQLRWDLATAGRGVVTVNTPRSKAVVGFATNRVFQLGDLTLAAATNRLGWCSFGATLTRGDTFTNDCTALIVASGWWENTGQVWKDATKNSVGNQWGGPPMLMEVIPFTLTLPIATNRVSVWRLDPTGQRAGIVQVTGSATNSVITVTPDAATIWYELEVAPHLTGYGLWRATNFTAIELTNPLISGDAATPANDGLPNLLKYYLGLPAKTPAPANRRPRGHLLTVTNEVFLAVSVDRDPAVADAACEPEVSGDLVQWFSGPGHMLLATTERVGALERVTWRDLTPVSAARARYLRLRCWRVGP